jgi:thioredoxin-dependent peroxiredoxin
MRRCVLWRYLLAGAFACSILTAPSKGSASEPPKVGDKAADFELKTLAGDAVKLSKLTETGPVVVLVLRGYPGYQCPLCTRQVGDFLAHAEKFAAAETNVVMIYPGPAEGLSAHAEEFLRDKKLPQNFHLLVDPEYSFVNAYHLRWDAPEETAYPSTFVIDAERRVRFAKISMKHGGRTKAADILAELSKLD